MRARRHAPDEGGVRSVTDRFQRGVLPIPDPQWPGLTTYDAKDPDTAFPPIEPVRPPDGAPNVLIILLDDVGFGASMTFGGPCNTPRSEERRVGKECRSRWSP